MNDDGTLGAIVGGKQHTAADFDASAPMLKLRELQGSMYGDDDKANGAGRKKMEVGGDLREIESMFGGGTLRDAAWSGNSAEVTRLLAKGIDVDARAAEGSGCTPLTCA